MWPCSAQAASNYITFEPTTEKFSMTPEQSFVFANQGSPYYLAPAFGAAAAFQDNMEQVKNAFRTGEGVAWGDQTRCLSCAVARFFRPGYDNHLVRSWLPALNGVVEKLEQGGEVADAGDDVCLRDVGAAGNGRQADVLLPGVVHIIVALGHQWRAGGNHHAQRRLVQFPVPQRGEAQTQKGQRAAMEVEFAI